MSRQSDEVTAGAEDREIIEKAQSLYANDDIEIDRGALVSRGDDGAWVQSWVYVRFAEDEEEE